MKTSRREFLKIGTAAMATSIGVTGCETLSEEQAITKRKFAGLKELPPAMPRLRVMDGALRGRVACKYVDDCIWFLRDLARQRPKHAFDHPFLAGFKKVHEATGLKVQFNLFYRTDFFYGMDEFTLAGMPDTYKAEFQTNADWIKFGFHSLQEFPDYPWINASYDDVAKCLKMIRGTRSGWRMAANPRRRFTRVTRTWRPSRHPFAAITTSRRRRTSGFARRTALSSILTRAWRSVTSARGR